MRHTGLDDLGLERCSMLTTRREGLEFWAESPIRVWDEEHQPIHLFSPGEVTAGGDNRFSETPADEPFARWLLGQFEPRAYITIDGPDGRWFGELGGFVVAKTEAGKSVLRVGWFPRAGQSKATA